MPNPNWKILPAWPTCRYLGSGIVLAALACALALSLTANPTPLHAATENADDFLIVDCLLPGQIRKLGTKVTFLSPRRPVRTNQGDCEIRGGEYAAYDRADYGTALKIWLPKAQEGDPKAQNYMGEMAEKGLGQNPDYEMAAIWYRRAAKQGHAPAQINLGQLYEKGLGVPQDQQAAVTWYRKASGLEGSGLNDVTFGDATAEIERLQTALDASTQEVTALRTELSGLNAELQQARAERQLVDNQIAAERQALTTERESLAARRQTLEAERANIQSNGKQEQLAAALAAERQRITQQAQQLASQKSALRKRQGELETKLQAVSQQLAQSSQSTNSVKAENAALQQQLAQQRLVLAQASAALRAQADQVSAREAEIKHREQALKTKKTVDRTAMEAALKKQAQGLAEREAALNQKETVFAQRERDLKALNDEIAKLDTQVKARQAELAKGNPAVLEQAAAEPNSDPALPRIEMIEPPILQARGTPIAYTRSGMSFRTVVGRAVAPGGLYKVFINDQEVATDDSAIFQMRVPLTANGTMVQIVALDKAGKRGDLSFELRQKRGTEVAAVTQRAETQSFNAEGVDFGNYYALVIGNKDYQKLPQLMTPETDANAVAELLKEKYGFKTRVLLNATRYQILSALNEMRAQLTDKDNFLLFYAGHGELDSVNQRGNWLPVDAEADSTANWISNIAVTDILNAMAVRKILVIADSCYSGSLTRSTLARLDAGKSPEAWRTWLKLMLDKRSRMVLSSGGVAPVLDGGGGRHSIFAKALIDTLQDNSQVLDGRTLHQKVAQSVSFAAADVAFEQVPLYSAIKYAGHEAGDFFFVPKI